MILLTADTHLSPRIWAKRPIEGDAYFAFEFLVSQAVNRRLDGMIVAGDIVDTAAADPETVSFLAEQIRRLEKVGIPFAFVNGNHDLPTPSWMHRTWGDVSGWATRLNRSGLTMGRSKWKVWGFDHVWAENWKPSLEKAPADTDLMVIHQAAEELEGGSKDAIKLRDIPITADILVGDTHTHKALDIGTSAGHSIRVLSPGTTCLQAINEELPKRAFLWKGRHAPVDVLKIPGRPLLTWFDLSTYADLDNLAQSVHPKLTALEKEAEELGLPEALRKPLFRVRYHRGIEDAEARIESCIGDRAHLFIDPIFHEEDRKERSNALPDARGRVKDVLTVAKSRLSDPEQVSRVARLLKSKSPGDEIQAMYEEFERSYRPESVSVGGECE